ncbi:MAG: asparagine synthase (glutamine-hydrolyzing), partial [Lentisphaeria bacterium]|nr:asparagine synthase (glutamine-hydrolyzing) [Lentisphaeria bacterium]
MCGIAGYFQTDGTPALPRHLRAMADAMIKCGPDGEGVFTDGPLGLAHRRLSIIDLEGGAQPMTTADGSLTVVFNGEIFNYRELRAELEKAGKFTFRTKSDTEVIPALYRAEGEDFVRRLNGFFAFALYDREKKKLLLARDRFGVKPLFYFQDGTRFAFASTLNALKTLPGFDRSDLSMESIAEFLAFQYIPGNATVYRNVFRLDPGSLMTLQLDDGSIRTRPFVSHGDRKTTSLSYEDARQHLRELVTDAVERRLNADVPLGVFLSGGLDSAIVCGTAATLMKEPLECFSIGFADPAYDESALARQSADFIQSYAKVPVRLHTKEADPCDFRLLSEMAREFGEPYADASLLPESLLCRFTRETVTTVVSGDGADELFGGYDRYRAMNFFHRAPLPRPLCRAFASL